MMGLGALSPTAFAQASPTDSELAAARTLGLEGVKLEAAGRCEEAVRLLSRASEIYAAPTLLVPLARCQIQLGQLVEAVTTLGRALDAEFDSSASRPFVAAQEEAEALLSATLPRVARLHVQLVAPAGAAVSVSVGGRPIPTEERAAVSLNPGQHEVTAKAPGCHPASETITVAEGERVSVKLTLKPLAEDSPLVDTEDEPQILLLEEDSTDETLGWVSLGIGAAGLVAGSVLGVLAMSQERDLQTSCPNGRCPPEASGDLDRANALALGSTIGFGVGILGLGVGSYFLFLKPTPSPAAGVRAPRPAPFEVYSSGHSLGVRGVF